MRDPEPPDWALPSWDSVPADPAEAGLRPVGPGRTPGEGRGPGAAAPGTRGARHLRRPDPRRQRGHPHDPRRRPGRPAPVRPVGRGRDRPGHDLVGGSRLLRAQGRAQPAPVRLVPRRPAALRVRGAGRTAGRRPRPDRPVRAAGRAPAVRRIDPAGGSRRPDPPVRGAQGTARRGGAVRRPTRKRPLPSRPATIAVITSPTGAVWKDICHVLARRWPLTRVVLVAAQVQGESAPGQPGPGVPERRALRGGPDRRRPARRRRPRSRSWPAAAGRSRTSGRSTTRRSCERSSPIRCPVVCGVGHEVDVTLCDFAADVRAPTPSAAAEVAVPDRADFLASVRQGGPAARCGRRRAAADGANARSRGSGACSSA